MDVAKDARAGMEGGRENKTAYTAAPDAGGWAGAVMSWAGAVMIWAGAVMNWAGHKRLFTH